MDNRKMLFITVPSNSKVELPTMGKIKNLWLQAYSIVGIPVTAGVPNSRHYNLHLDNANSHVSTWVRSDHKNGFPLLLNGAFTSQIFSNGIKVGQDLNLSLANPQVNLLNDDETAATYTEANLWFYYN